MIELEYGDKGYPIRLAAIPNPPRKLYVVGNVELLGTVGMAVIGSRHHSDYGKNMCKKFTKDLVLNGVTIVSGLANGIDGIAHKTCLENEGSTIAVLPCGFNNIFPPENKKLFKDILKLGGVAITEYGLDEEAESYKFIQRNRIVAGLGIGTLVIEAGYHSGTSVTAQITKEQGKKVFCVPSSLDNRRGITCNQIIRKGGKLVTSVDEILEEFKNIEFKKREVHPNHLVDEEFLEVYYLLDDNPKHINEISKRLNCTISDVNYKLMMLELEGHVVQLPGKYFKRK